MKSQDNTAFLDLLFNTLLGFVMLFFISFYLMNPSQSKADIKTKAEFVITVTWTEGNECDVDTYLQDPLGNILFFQQKEKGLMHLDRDDLGNVNDTIILPNGETIRLPVNQELTTIRGFIPGEWVLNVHLYKKRTAEGAVVEIFVDKLNPKVRKLFYKKITLSEQWQEVTVARFTMTEQGKLWEWNSLPKKLVESIEVVPSPSFSEFDN